MNTGSPVLQWPGGELHIAPDPTGVVVRFGMTGGLAGLSRTVTITPAEADALAIHLRRCVLRSRDMHASMAEKAAP